MSAEYYHSEEVVVDVKNKLASIDALQTAVKFKQELVFSRDQHYAPSEPTSLEAPQLNPQRIPTEDPYIFNEKRFKRVPKKARSGNQTNSRENFQI